MDIIKKKRKESKPDDTYYNDYNDKYEFPIIIHIISYSF